MLQTISIEKFLIGGGVICTFVGGLTLWKDRQNQKRALEPAYKYPKNLEDKVYLITGANTGNHCFQHPANSLLENFYGYSYNRILPRIFYSSRYRQSNNR